MVKSLMKLETNLVMSLFDQIVSFCEAIQIEW